MAPRDTSSASMDWQVNYPEIKMRSAHLLRSREWADCEFVFGTCMGDAASSLEAHKLILAMASPVFAAMFYGHIGDKEGPILISDIDHSIFSSMLDYIYTDEVDITNIEMACDLFRAANKYILVHLERKCINYLLNKLCPQKVCYIYELSCMYYEEELMKKCVEMFSTKTLEILKADSFKDAQLETVRMIFSLDSLNIDSELDLYEALVDYTKKTQFSDNGASVCPIQEENKTITEVSQPSNNDDTINDKSTDTKDLNTGDWDGSGSGNIMKERITLRTHVSTVMEEIRFLTLAPETLAECPSLYALLSETEILALSMNILSVNTVIPMPAGFSTSRMPRNQGKKGRSFCTEQIIVNNLSKLKKYESKTFCVRNIPWMVEIKPFYKKNLNNDNHLEKRVQVDIICLLELKQPWTLNTQLGIRVIPISTNALNVSETCRTISTELSRENDGIQTSFSWKMLTDPAYGVTAGDDSLNIEVYVAIEELKITKTEVKQTTQDLLI